MKSALLPAAAALLALAACNNKPAQPEVVDTNPDPMATQLANRAPVELPPAIKAEKTFRCKAVSPGRDPFVHKKHSASLECPQFSSLRPRKSRQDVVVESLENKVHTVIRICC